MITLKTHDFKLPLRHVFSISRESTSVQPTLIVELTDGVHRGFGEATTNKYYGATLGLMRESLESVRAIVESAEPLDPEKLWDQTWPLLKGNPFAQCALDQAANDLWGKQQGSPVYKLWGLSTDRIPQSNFTIGIDTVEVMVQKLLEMPGWPIYKIKLGTPEDLAIVRELRRHTTAVFRVDANCAWSVEQTLALAPALRDLGVEFIEQPLPAADRAGMRRIFQECVLPVIADESCLVEEDVPGCAGLFHGINIKLTKAGGLTPARRMIRRARDLGLKVMVGCMTESSVGISAIAQLLPLLDYVDMDGSNLIARDIASGVAVERGRAIFPAENGNGVRLL